MNKLFRSILPCFFLLVGVYYANATVKILKINPETADKLGSIELIISGDAGPFTINWQGCTTGTAKVSGSDKETSYIINNACAGKYSINIINKYGCATPTIEAVVEKCGLRAYVKNITHAIPSPDVKHAYETLGEIELAIESDEPYTIHWSNGGSKANLYRLIPGVYEAIITGDNSHCSVRVSATILEAKCQSASNFDLRIMGGLLLCQSTEASVFLQYKKTSSTQFSYDIPTNLIYYWELNGKTIAYNTPTILITKDMLNKELAVVATNGCISQRAIIQPANFIDVSADLLIREKKLPCERAYNGSVNISFVIPGINLGNLSLEINDIPYPINSQTILDNQTQIDALVGGLFPRKTYLVTLSIGECQRVFSFKLDPEETKENFIEYKDGKCIMQPECQGMKLSLIEKNPTIDADNANWTGLIHIAGLGGCKAPIKCGDMQVGTKKVGIKKVTAEKYKDLLELAASNASQLGLSETDLRIWLHDLEGISPCATVHFCPLNLKKSISFSAGLREQIIQNGYCKQIKCYSVGDVALRFTKDEYCINDLADQLSLENTNECILVLADFYRLVLQYQVQPAAFENEFKGTEVEDYVRNYVDNENSKGGECATIVFCSDTKQVKNYYGECINGVQRLLYVNPNTGGVSPVDVNLDDQYALTNHTSELVLCSKLKATSPSRNNSTYEVIKCPQGVKITPLAPSLRLGVSIFRSLTAMGTYKAAKRVSDVMFLGLI